jgi:uncharacterized protein GlcG (DUF336 family)
MRQLSVSVSKRIRCAVITGGVLLAAMNSSSAFAACPVAGVTFAALETALQNAVNAGNGGLGFDMWATIVDRDGVVCLVAKSGAAGEQWPGSRVISAQKANTANAFSLPGFALSTANLFSATQPGGSLFGLQESNPVDTAVAYVGSSATWGTAADDLVGQKIGGVNVFGGGLGLYDEDGALVGGLGVSGDTSCADHNIAWRVRQALDLDHVPSGVAPAGNDGIIYDVTGGHGNFASKSGFGHPLCGGTENDVAASIGAGG